MGGALLTSVAKTVAGDKICVCDQNKEKVNAFTEAKMAKESDLANLVKTSHYIVLGVKPQGFSALFDEIRPILQERKDEFILVSMAAGVSIQRIEELSGKKVPVIRLMPNTPVKFGEGMILYTVNDLVTKPQEDIFLTAFSKAGIFDRIPEAKIDAGGALSGCGPAFVYLFAEALADGGVECGLTREQAKLYAAQTLLGSARMLLSDGRSPAELKDAVCSPGGTTIAGVHALEKGKFRATVMDAVTAAFEKTAKLK